MRLLRKLVAMVVYAAVLFPGSDYRVTAWVRAIEVASTALDKTMRRRKSRLENDRFARTLHLVQIADGEREDATGRFRPAA